MYCSSSSHSCLQFKSTFEAKQEASGGYAYVYSDDIMGASGISAIGASLPSSLYCTVCCAFTLRRRVLQRHVPRRPVWLHHAPHVVDHIRPRRPCRLFVFPLSLQPPPPAPHAAAFIAALFPHATSRPPHAHAALVNISQVKLMPLAALRHSHTRIYTGVRAALQLGGDRPAPCCRSCSAEAETHTACCCSCSPHHDSSCSPNLRGGGE